MSNAKTVGQLRQEAQFAANEAQSDLAFAEGEVRRLGEYFAKVMASPDFQETMLEFWHEADAARRKSGLGVREFAQALFTPVLKVAADGKSIYQGIADMTRHLATVKVVPHEGPLTPSPKTQPTVAPATDAHATQLRVIQEREAMERAKVHADAARRLTLALYPNAEKTQDFETSLKEVRALVTASEMRLHAARAKAMADTGGGPPPAPCSCGQMQACERCPELQVTPEIAAYIKARADDDAKLMGLNSVTRGDAKQDTSVHAQVEEKLRTATRALSDAACALGAVIPWAGEVYGEKARVLTNEVTELASRAAALKLVIAP